MDSRYGFFDSILPIDGFYCVLGIRNDKKKKQLFVSTIDEVLEVSKKLDSAEYNVYFGCAKYEDSSKGRLATNAKWFKSFRVDLDCGEGKPYKNQAGAIDALRRFTSKIDLPRPTIVNSGRGVHVYWALQESVTLTDWKLVADALHAACVENGFETDSTVTVDAARVLRVPGTRNFKSDPPSKVAVLCESAAIAFDDFKQLLGKWVSTAPVLPPRSSVKLDATTMALMGNKASNFSLIVRKSLKGSGCAQIASIVRDQAGVDYNLWRGGLSIAGNCEDGPTAIHKISKGHPNYSAEETETKSADTFGKPYKCSTFSSINSALCAGCQHSGKITSPIQLGHTIREAEPEDNIVVIKNPETSEDAQIVIPEYPFPYYRGKVGGVYRRAPKVEGDAEVQEDELISKYDFYVVKRMIDPTLGECIWLRLHTPKDGVKEFGCPLTTLTSNEKFSTLIAQHGLVARYKKLEGLMQYTMRWVDELQNMLEAEKARQQFGWCDNDTKFVVGTREISAIGVSNSPISSTTAELANIYTKKGNIHDWSQVADIYARPGNEARAFALFAGFGSVLFKFTNLSGAIIHLTNNSSGVGKTTIQMLINSIWGRPVEALLNQSDKYLARMNRIKLLGNLPPTIDEMTNSPDIEVSDMAYALSHGRERNRMQSQVNAERINTLRWSLIAVTSGNKSLHDQLYNLKSFPEGELMRIMEINISKNDTLSKEETDMMFRPIYDNYGIAGEIFIRYVIPNLPAVLNLLRDVQIKIDTATGFTQKERFWSAIAACSMTAGIITHKLGLHNIPTQPVYKWATETLRVSKKETAIQLASSMSNIGHYLNEHTNNMLIVNSFLDKRSGLMQAPIREPRGELTIRYEPDTKRLFLTSKQLREWCSEHQISYKAMKKELIDTGAFESESKKHMAKGFDINTPAVNVWVINCGIAKDLDIDVYVESNN